MKYIKKLPIAILALLSVGLLSRQTYGVAVMSVDLGSEWMKVAIVSPGVPMEIALNKESKRKTPAAISFRNNERKFGEDAIDTGTRFPLNTFAYILDLVGKPIDNPIVELFKKRFPYYNIEPDTERGTIQFRIDENTTYSPEELLAQLLYKAKEMAEISANQKIKDAVLTIPGYFNQAERKAILQAAELVNINVLQLFNDYSAVALNYGIFNQKQINESATYIMFYDMGASSTTATIVSYQIVKTKEKGYVETHPHVSVLGVGYDRTLGGLEKTLRLRDYLANEFDALKKTDKSVFNNPRAMAKLFKEAGRVKTVLSANVETFAQIEGLLDEQDFKHLVTREKFEELCDDLFKRVSNPVEMALKSSGLSLDIISQIVLVGAGTRVPKVQEVLKAYIKRELAKNINTDEAPAMGAAYKAADLSKGFKVKKFTTKDAVVFPIQIVFDRTTEDGQIKQVKRMLFDRMNSYPQKKIITFNKHNQDFSFYVNYARLDHLSEEEISAIGSFNLSTIHLTGVAEALEKHAKESAEIKGIKAHFTMDESGVLRLTNTELVSEKTMIESVKEEEGAFSKLGSTISKLFSGSDDKEKVEKAEEAPKEDVKPITEEADETEPKKETDKDAKTSNETKPVEEKVENKTEKAENKKEKKPVTVTLKDPIEARIENLGPKEFTPEQLLELKAKLDALNKRDQDKIERENAQNELETAVIDTREKLLSEEYGAATTPEESKEILQVCNEIRDWLDEEADPSTSVETYKKKLSELQDKTNGVYERVFEHRERPEVLKGMASMINGSRKFLAFMQNVTETLEIFTEIEITTLEKVINETQEYHDLVIKEMAEVKLYEPVLHKVRDIAKKMAALDREVKYLDNKRKLWRPKPEVKPKNTTEKTEESKPSEDKSKTEKASDEGKTEPKEEEKVKDKEAEEKEPKTSEAEETVELPGASDETTESKGSDVKDDKHSEL